MRAQTIRVREHEAPLWAVLGAPIIGVLLLLALIAFGSIGPAEGSQDMDVGEAVEHVDSAQPVQRDGMPSMARLVRV
ncbi:MAG TPA: hypothetical protein VFQ22_09500 [Longimicrobiales bacterium]|nr:hypothetical protein [Longimicrobiales bacterium]